MPLSLGRLGSTGSSSSVVSGPAINYGLLVLTRLRSLLAWLFHPGCSGIHGMAPFLRLSLQARDSSTTWDPAAS